MHPTSLPNAAQLLIVGAGPYGLSTAALAQERGIETVILGRPMAFWEEHMPAAMYLRSSIDWHLDASGIHTFHAFLDERQVPRVDADPVPIRLFLEYVEWFRQVKQIDVRDDLVVELAQAGGQFEARLGSGAVIRADAVVCAPGARHYANLPDWAAGVPNDRAAHTCDLVRFDDLAGARVLIVGGRQSAYEWAALIREHGADRIDIVHRHDVPRFARVSWAFIDEHVERTTQVRGYWRRLPRAQQEAIAARFWQVGRLTLEDWLTPRLDWDGMHRWPGTEVVDVARPRGGEALRIGLSNSERLTVDQVVFATGYRADLARVPYLAGLRERIAVVDGFPVLDESLGASLPGLYITGFSATRDFGPFFGFVKGAPASATLIVQDLLSRH